MACAVQESKTNTQNSLKAEAVRNRLNDRVSEVAQSIAAESEKRRDYMQNVDLLKQGIFYPHEYFKALEATGQKDQLNGFLNRNSFHDGYLKHFGLEECLWSDTGKNAFNFTLKKGADPVEALHSVRNGISLMGCGEVCQLAQYEAVLDILGPEKFKTLFSADSSTPLMLGPQHNNPIGRLRSYIMKEIPDLKGVKKGDLVYFKNVDAYSTKHLKGTGSGYNTICIDEAPRFTTLGLSSQGATQAELNEILIQDYNLPFTYLECLSEKTRKAFLASVGPLSEERAHSQISAEDFVKQKGGKVTLVCELDAEKIALLAHASLEKGRLLLDRFKARMIDRSS